MKLKDKIFQFFQFQFSFFDIPSSLYTYITIYISINYKVFKRGFVAILLNWNLE
jgi:hypothetical protein